MADSVSYSYLKPVLSCQKVNTSNVVTDDGTRTLGTFEMKSWRTTGPSYPDWKDRIANGQDATTELTAGRRTLKIGSQGFVRNSVGGSAIACNKVWGPRHLKDPQIPLGTKATFDATLQQQAREEAYKNLIKSYRTALSQWQSGVFLGELPELVRFLKSPARSLMRLTANDWVSLARQLRRLGKGKIDGRNSAVFRAATDSFLAWQYAVKPLVSDIGSAYEALHAHLTDVTENQVFRLRGDGKVKSRVHGYSFISSFTSDQGTAYGANNCSTKWDKTTEVSVRFIGAYKPYGPKGTVSLPERLGWMPNEWVPTAYELIPWSFVADYFSNLGKLIDAVSFSLVSLPWLMETSRQKYDVEISDMSYYNAENGYAGPANPSIDYASGGRVRDKHFLVHRKSVTNNVVPNFRVKLPNLGQALNLAALLNSSLPFRR